MGTNENNFFTPNKTDSMLLFKKIRKRNLVANDAQQKINDKLKVFNKELQQTCSTNQNCFLLKQKSTASYFFACCLEEAVWLSSFILQQLNSKQFQ